VCARIAEQFKYLVSSSQYHPSLELKVVFFSLRRWDVALVIVVVLGCSNAPKRIAAPKWDPNASADTAIEEFDADGNGILSMDELDAAPGLKFCLKRADTDEDGQLSRQEIVDRVKLYKDSGIGLKMFSCKVVLDGRPLSGALVRIIPEPFLGGVGKPASGTTSKNGRAQLVAEEADVPAAQIGMYRVEITCPDKKILPKYNERTELGVEISPVSEEPGETDQRGTVVFRMKSR